MRKAISTDLYVDQNRPINRTEVLFHQGLILSRIIRNSSMGQKKKKNSQRHLESGEHVLNI